MVFNSKRSYLVCGLLGRWMSSNNKVNVSQGQVSEKFTVTFIYTVDFQGKHQAIVTALLP